MFFPRLHQSCSCTLLNLLVNPWSSSYLTCHQHLTQVTTRSSTRHILHLASRTQYSPAFFPPHWSLLDLLLVPPRLSDLSMLEYSRSHLLVLFSSLCTHSFTDLGQSYGFKNHVLMTPKFLSPVPISPYNSRLVYPNKSPTSAVGCVLDISNTVCPQLNLLQLLFSSLTPFPILTVGNSILLVAQTKSFLFLTPHLICQEIRLALPSKHIWSLTRSLHITATGLAQTISSCWVGQPASSLSSSSWKQEKSDPLKTQFYHGTPLFKPRSCSSPHW